MSEQEQEQTQGDETQEQDGPEPDVPITPEQAAEEEEAGDEDVEGAPPEPEPGAEQPEGLSQKQLEQAFGKLEREARRHTQRVHEIMGSDVELLLVCPLCDPLTPGQIMPTPATPERFPAVREFMGDAQPVEFEPADDARRCEKCNGRGMVDTGSKVQGQEALPCKACGARGWVGSRADTASPVAPAPAQVAQGNGEAQPAPAGFEPPEAAALRAAGYTLIPPVGAPS